MSKMKLKPHPLMDKRQLFVFTKTKSCPLKHGELMVYCFGAYQARYDHVPTYAGYAKATGLSKNTIRGHVEKLTALGLFDENGKALPAPADWFAAANNGTHWSQAYAGWWCLIKSSQCPISLYAVAIYSLLVHAWRSERKSQWTFAYLAQVMGCDVHTAAKCVAAGADLFDWNGGKPKLYECEQQHFGWFLDKSAFAVICAAEVEMIKRPNKPTATQRQPVAQQATQPLALQPASNQPDEFDAMIARRERMAAEMQQVPFTAEDIDNALRHTTKWQKKSWIEKNAERLKISPCAFGHPALI